MVNDSNFALIFAPYDNYLQEYHIRDLDINARNIEVGMKFTKTYVVDEIDEHGYEFSVSKDFDCYIIFHDHLKKHCSNKKAAAVELLEKHYRDPLRHEILIEFGKKEMSKVQALGGKRNVDRQKYMHALEVEKSGARGTSQMNKSASSSSQNGKGHFKPGKRPPDDTAKKNKLALALEAHKNAEDVMQKIMETALSTNTPVSSFPNHNPTSTTILSTNSPVSTFPITTTHVIPPTCALSTNTLVSFPNPNSVSTTAHSTSTPASTFPVTTTHVIPPTCATFTALSTNAPVSFPNPNSVTTTALSTSTPVATFPITSTTHVIPPTCATFTALSTNAPVSFPNPNSVATTALSTSTPVATFPITSTTHVIPPTSVMLPAVSTNTPVFTFPITSTTHVIPPTPDSHLLQVAPSPDNITVSSILNHTNNILNPNSEPIPTPSGSEAMEYDCEECFRKEGMIEALQGETEQLREENQRLTNELQAMQQVNPRKQNESDMESELPQIPAEADVYQPSRGRKIDKCYYKILKPGQLCPDGYQVLENTSVAVPSTFLSTFILSTKKADSKGSRVKRLLSAFFEPKDMFNMNASKMTTRYPTLMEGIRLYSMNHIKVTRSEFNKFVFEKCFTMTRSVKKMKEN